MNLNLELVKSIQIPIPPYHEQQKIVSILALTDSFIQVRKIYKSELMSIKKGLMQKLLTGKIRVKDMNFVGVQDDKDEWLKSELPALEQLYAMGYEYIKPS